MRITPAVPARLGFVCVVFGATLLVSGPAIGAARRSDEIVPPTLSSPAQPGGDVQLSDGRLRETVAQLDAGKKPPSGVSVRKGRVDVEILMQLPSGQARALVEAAGGQVLGSVPGELVQALEGQPAKRIAIDGEVVAFDGSQTSFAKLARRGRERVPVFLYVFDLLWLDGRDVRPLPLRDRKRLLREALSWKDPIRFTTHRNRDGEKFFTEACRKGWEGLIAKRDDSPYASRARAYMSGSAVAFDRGHIGVIQVLGSKGGRVPSGRAWMLAADDRPAAAGTKPA